jgi:hypothetical protein
MDDVGTNTTRAKVLLNLSKSLSQRPIQATVPLYGRSERNELELLGSGVLLRVENEVFLLTARHVLDALPTQSRYIAVGDNVNILDAVYSSTKSLEEGREYDPFDLAYFHLGSSLVGKLGSNKPISMNDLDLENYSTSGQVYLIIGFPVSKQPRMPKRL